MPHDLKSGRRGLLFLACVSVIWVACSPSATPDGDGEYVEHRAFLRREADYYRRDDIVGHLHQPNAERPVAWQEHPRSRFVMRTNNLGFREDEPTPGKPVPGKVRILVTGDSHVDGVVNNAESFPNVLENLLNAGEDGRVFEVINGGVGYFGPYQYSRFLTRFADLDPDVFIVTCYLGNDFLDAAVVLEATGRASNDRPREYLKRLSKSNGLIGAAVAQSLNQSFYMATFPAMVDAALEFSESCFADIQRQCSLSAIRLIVLVLPTRMEIARDSERPTLVTAKEVLGLSETDIDLELRLRDRFLSWLRERGVETLDLAPALRSVGDDAYWRRDHHLAVDGHRAVAVAIMNRYQALFEEAKQGKRPRS